MHYGKVTHFTRPTSLTKTSEWCMKMCVVTFFFRIKDGSKYMTYAPKVTWWFIVLSFIAILLATLVECRPLSLFVSLIRFSTSNHTGTDTSTGFGIMKRQIIARRDSATC